VRTKEPTLRITKWLKAASIPGSDIPLEAECTACPDAHFETPFSLRNHLAKPFHQPDRERFHEHLRRAFELHLKETHSKKS